MKKLFLLFFFLSGCIYYNTFYNAEKYYSEKNYNKSIEKCKKVLKKYPGSGFIDDAIFLMGKNYFYLESYDEAKESFKRIIDFFPNSPFVDESYLFLGKVALKKKDVNESIIFLENAANSDDPVIRMETFKTKLEVYLLTDEPEKTIEEGEKFIKRYSGNSEEAYYIIGNANRLIGDDKMALEMYKNALKKSSSVPYGRLIYSMAELYSEMDSLKEALSIIEEGKKSDSLSLLKGKILIELEDFEEAEKSLEPVNRRRDSLGVVAKYHLGEIKELQGDTSGALELYKKAASMKDFGEISKKARAKEEIFENIFLLRERTGESEDGEAESEGFFGKDPIKNDEEKVIEQDYERKDSSYIFFRIGELYYWELNETEEGVAWYKKVHEEFPTSSYAPKAIFTLLNIELKEDSTFSPEAKELFSILTGKYPNTKYSEKAKELYEPYFQDTTSTRE